MTVEFKFEIGQKIKTIFEDCGVIEMAAIDDSCQKKYFVQRSNESQWMKESQLIAV